MADDPLVATIVGVIRDRHDARCFATEEAATGLARAVLHAIADAAKVGEPVKLTDSNGYGRWLLTVHEEYGVEQTDGFVFIDEEDPLDYQRAVDVRNEDGDGEGRIVRRYYAWHETGWMPVPWEPVAEEGERSG